MLKLIVVASMLSGCAVTMQERGASCTSSTKLSGVDGLAAIGLVGVAAFAYADGHDRTDAYDVPARPSVIAGAAAAATAYAISSFVGRGWAERCHR